MMLDAGPLIIDRIKAACAISPANTFSAADLAAVVAATQANPARHVVLHSYEPMGDVGSDAQWQEVWLVVIVVKNVKQGVGAEAIRNDAGPMLLETLSALQGLKVPGYNGVLESVPPPRPLIAAGFGYFPLAFRARVCVGGVDPDVY